MEFWNQSFYPDLVKTGIQKVELKSSLASIVIEWDILNQDPLIWLFNVHTFDFLLLILFLDILLYKVTFDNNYRYNAISIGMLSNWIKFKNSITIIYKVVQNCFIKNVALFHIHEIGLLKKDETSETTVWSLTFLFFLNLQTYFIFVSLLGKYALGRRK